MRRLVLAVAVVVLTSSLTFGADSHSRYGNYEMRGKNNAVTGNLRTSDYGKTITQYNRSNVPQQQYRYQNGGYNVYGRNNSYQGRISNMNPGNFGGFYNQSGQNGINRNGR